MKNLYGSGVYIIGNATYNLDNTSRMKTIPVPDADANKLLELKTPAPEFDPIIFDIDEEKKSETKAKVLSDADKLEAARELIAEADAKKAETAEADAKKAETAEADAKKAETAEADAKKAEEEAAKLGDKKWEDLDYNQKKVYANMNGYDLTLGSKAKDLEKWFAKRTK